MERSELVRRITAYMEQRRRPRALLSSVVAVAGLAGFGVSVALLAYGITSMTVRYGIAGLAAYLSFICLLRFWATTQVPDAFDPVLDLNAIPDMSFAGGDSHGSSPDAVFDAGRSGGGGATGMWSEPAATRSRAVRPRPRRVRGPDGGFDFSVDGDDAVWIVVLVAAVFSGLVALVFVVYAAPGLLAEVIVDAVIVTEVYRRVAVKDGRHWAATVVRRTWFPAFVVIVSLIAGGYALQQLVPEARSVGPALGALAKRF